MTTFFSMLMKMPRRPEPCEEDLATATEYEGADAAWAA
jgi:hypothetical protein